MKKSRYIFKSIKSAGRCMDKFGPLKFGQREANGPIKNVELEFIILHC